MEQLAKELAELINDIPGCRDTWITPGIGETDGYIGIALTEDEAYALIQRLHEAQELTTP